MQLIYSTRFKKNFKKRIPQNPNTARRFEERIKLFLENRNDPTIHDHKLVGEKQSFRAFSITGDIRVVYFLEQNGDIILIDIGTHNQVYRKA